MYIDNIDKILSSINSIPFTSITRMNILYTLNIQLSTQYCES